MWPAWIKQDAGVSSTLSTVGSNRTSVSKVSIITSPAPPIFWLNKANLNSEHFSFALRKEYIFKNKQKPLCIHYPSHFQCEIGQFSSVTQSCSILCDPMDCSTPGFPVHHQLPKFTQTHVHRVGDAIQPSHPLSSPSPPAFNLSQHQGLFQWVNSSHEVAKVLEFQLQHQSFQWIFRTDLL